MEHTLALLGLAHQGDKEARDTLFQENTGLIWSIAKRFLGRGVEMEDLFQIGSIGLLKAVDKFDPQYDVKFSTYAVPMITGEIKRFLRDDGRVRLRRLRNQRPHLQVRNQRAAPRRNKARPYTADNAVPLPEKGAARPRLYTRQGRCLKP